MLLATDRDGNSVIHIAANYGSLDVIQKLLNWAKEKLSAEEINKLLWAKNRDRYSLILKAAGYGRLDRNFLIGLRKNLTTE